MKNIKDYLPFYLGCECMVVNHFKSIIIGINTNGNIQVAHAKSSQTFWESEYIKPILRTISSMTEQELLKSTLFAYNPPFINSVAESIRYLTSIRIDVFNLIDEGLAIDEKTLNI